MSMENLASWIEWSRDQMSQWNTLPDIRTAADTPWFEHIFEIFEEHDPDEVQEVCRGAIDRNTTDPAARFTTLSILHDLFTLQVGRIYEGDIGLLEDLLEEAAQYERYFRELVLGVRIDQLDDWSRIQWELTNSFVAKDMDLLGRLLNRAAQLQAMADADLHALGGQARFALAFEAELEACARGDPASAARRAGLDSVKPVLQGVIESGTVRNLLWDSQLLDGQGVGSCFCFLASTSFSIKTTQKEFDLISDGANELKKAFSRRTALPGVYRSMLARCYYGLKEWGPAAENYALALESEKQSEASNWRYLLYLSIAASYRSAGEIDKAIESLEGCAQEFPGRKDLHLEVAELQALRGNYSAVYEHLEQEKLSDPGFGEDWRFSTILALGGIGEMLNREAGLREKLIQAHPVIAQAINSIVAEYWPGFGALGEEARKEFEWGSFLFHYCRHLQKDLESQSLGWSAVAFAKAVEVELKERVFARFREHALSHGGKQQQPSQEERVLQDYVSGKPALTLGQMKYVLEKGGRAKGGILRALHKWVQDHYPKLTHPLLLTKLGYLAELRSTGVHGEPNIREASKAPQHCRALLDALHSGGTKIL